MHGIRIDLRGPTISHLFFADDSLIFTRATEEECQALLSCLRIYESASGQKINYDKLGISFSPNTEQNVQEGIQSCPNI